MWCVIFTDNTENIYWFLSPTGNAGSSRDDCDEGEPYGEMTIVLIT